jgi:hypothetical protein
MALDCTDTQNRRTYYLHNEFSGRTLSLPELDSAIGHVSELFEIRKMLLRSTPDDVIALMTNHSRCPIILTRRGNGVWFPECLAASLTRIIDITFLGDRLYGITQTEDLIFLDIASDDKGVPMVTGGEFVIGEDFDTSSNEEDSDDGDDDDDNNEEDWDDGDDDDDKSDDDDDDKSDDDAYDADGDGDQDFSVNDDSSKCEDKYKNNNDEEYDEIEDDDQHTYDFTKMTKDDIIDEVIQVNDFGISMMWYLIESRGKLLMVRRQVLPLHNRICPVTHKVEIFEADMNASKWVSVDGGLDGHALFISRPFCKSISAACSKEIQEDVIYFADTDDAFYMRSKTVSAPVDDWDYTMNLRKGVVTWVFPPELLAH